MRRNVLRTRLTVTENILNGPEARKLLDTVELDQVLMVGEGEDVKVGTPYLDGGKVTAKVVEHGRGKKIRIVKFQRRKHHRKQMGHRQDFTKLEITGIDA